MFQAHLPQSRAWFANLHEFIVRLATGQPLSSEAFRQEGPGYAFRSGRIRLYGGYSLKHKGHFVLSHPTYKTKQKLSTADAQKIEQCIREFDELDIPPKV